MEAVAVASRRLWGLLTRRFLTPPSQGLTFSLHPVSYPGQDEVPRAAPVEAPGHSYQFLRVTSGPEHILHMQIQPAEKTNALRKAFWGSDLCILEACLKEEEMVECFNKISENADCCAVVISGEGEMFTSGIDLTDMASGLLQPPGDDVARKSWYLRNIITRYQETFSVIEKCPKPVIAAIHGGCIGAGVDLITACDIRYCAQDAFFQVKVDMGVASDVGTLQRLPRVIGSQILVNELAFTARKLMADEARSSGLVSRVFPDKEALLDAAFSLAAEISSKSPVAVQGTKVNLLYARDRLVADSLNFVRNWNMNMLQTDDIVKSVQAAMEKKELKSVTFSKL